MASPWASAESYGLLWETATPDGALRARGLTVIELLLVIATIAIIGALATPALTGFLVRNQLKNTTNELVSAFRTAQLNAMAAKRDSTWGTNVSTAAITLFQGSSFASRNTTFDEVYAIPPSITVTPSEIVFAKLTGNPSATPTITVQSTVGQTRTVTVNAVGTVDVN